MHTQSIVPATDPVASQRAPTLMAGAVPGDHSEVRVWVPDRKEIWAPFQTVMPLTATYLIMVLISGLVFHHMDSALLTVTMLYAAGGFITSVWASKRPPYVTTDSHGIGITTRKRSRALLWTEIQSILQRSTFFSVPLLEIRTSEIIRVPLLGLSYKVRQELIDLISEKAHLQKDKKDYRLHTRAPDALPPP